MRVNRPKVSVCVCVCVCARARTNVYTVMDFGNRIPVRKLISRLLNKTWKFFINRGNRKERAITFLSKIQRRDFARRSSLTRQDFHFFFKHKVIANERATRHRYLEQSMNLHKTEKFCASRRSQCASRASLCTRIRYYVHVCVCVCVCVFS